MQNKIKTYVIGILIPLVVGGLSAFLTMGNMDIYGDIIKPPLAPPGILFGIVWPVLYVLMGIGSAMVYSDEEALLSVKESALWIYGVQLVFNFLWSIVFFKFEAFLLSFVIIIILWALILLMINKFSEINKLAGWLQIPYLLWVTFAAYLNLAIYILNR